MLDSRHRPAASGPAAPAAASADPAFEVRSRSGERLTFGSGAPSFIVHVADLRFWGALLEGDEYTAGTAFVRGVFDVEGDLLQALRWWRARPQASSGRERMLRLLSRVRWDSWFQPVGRARRNIRFHYDRSNRFYQQFLDSRLVYSCAYFADPSWSLDEAQLAKLDHVCRKLDLAPGDRFLDVGCGWGALVIHASGRYGAEAVGCTLSAEQLAFGRDAVRRAGLEGRVRLYDRDYRELDGRFDKIASIGMFEHVGRRRLRAYFTAIARLLNPDGLFLNHGLIRPSSVHEGGATVFLQRRVFPGAELTSLGHVVAEAEAAGFEVIDVENLRPHYALTSAAWIARLQERRDACLSIVDPETYRTWLLYLAGACIALEQGQMEIHQLLLAKRSLTSARRLSRGYMYGAGAAPVIRFGPAGPRW